jgi:plastocyanin domain-containing protein
VSVIVNRRRGLMIRSMFIPALIFGAVVASGCASGPEGGMKEIQVAVTDNGFEPKEIRVKEGDDVTLVVTRRTDQTCATEIVVAGGKARVTLPLDQPVRVALGTVDSGGVKFACGMGMLEGAVVVR